MMIDLIRFFGDALTDKNKKASPVSFTEIRGIHTVRVCENEEGEILLIVDNLGYHCRSIELAVYAAKALVDLISEAVEDSTRERVEMAGRTASKSMKEVLQEIEKKE